MTQNTRHISKILSAYYGMLQTTHLLALTRAGLLMLSGQVAPFPILPPQGGWDAGAMPFLFGLAGMDVIGILLGLVFTYRMLFKKNFSLILGLLSLTIFISGAIVFAVGTFPSGAWNAYPFAYWIMVVLFLPAGWLYIRLLKAALQPTKQHPTR